MTRPRAGDLTPDQQVMLLSGVDMWHTAAIPQHDIPAVRLTDGPAGARGTVFTGGERAINVPCGTALAATFDVDLVRRVGALLGRETRSKGARVLLAPTVNLHRTPVGGRNFECFSEDPHLSAEMAVAYVEGVQSEGVACCIKHLVGNDTEAERMSVDVRIDEVTLHELYLRPFEAAVTRADVMAVMTGYNRLDGAWCADHLPLLRDVLRDRWGFEGIVISDWNGLHSTAEAVHAGLDLEMPGPTIFRGDRLRAAMADGRVEADDVEAAADRVLAFLDRVGALQDGGPGPETTREAPDDLALVRTAAAAGMVLLHNPDRVLPLDRAALRRVAVLGPNAQVGQPMGGGSAHVDPVSVVHPLDGLRAALPDAEVLHAPGALINKRLPDLREGLHTGLDIACWRGVDGLDGDDDPVSRQHVAGARIMWQDDPDGTFPKDEGFSARLRSTFTPDATGAWSLSLTAVGHARLLVDGQVVVDNAEAPVGDSFFGVGRAEARGAAELREGIPVELLVELRVPVADVQLYAVAVGAQAPVDGDPVDAAVALAADADVAVVVVGTNDDWESEGWDRTTLALPGEQDRLVHEVAAAARRTVVVVNAGSPVLMPWLDEVDAVLMAWFPGQALGAALADVLLGVAEPGGRLPVTFPRSLAETPAVDDHPPVDGRMTYREGRLIGHHWHTARGAAPLFPFGFGLGWGDPAVTAAEVMADEMADEVAGGSADGMAEGVAGGVRVTVANRGPRATTAVVQAYARCPDEQADGREDLPPWRLAGFGRVHVAEGAEAEVVIVLDRRALERWDVSAGAWRLAGPATEVAVGLSAASLTHQVTIEGI